MMPSNTPPLENQKLQDDHDASEHSTNSLARQNALMQQLLASRQHQTRRFDTHLHQQESSQHPNDSGAMLHSGLNDSMMGYAHQQQQQQQDNLRHSQHDSLRHPHHDMQQHSYNDADELLQREQLSQHLSDLQQHHQQHNVQDSLTGGSSNMHQFSGGGNVQNNNNSLGQFGNGHHAMRQNANQAQQHHVDDDLLSMMLMAGRQANVPSVFNTMLNTNEQGEGSSSAVSEADMLRAYNQSLSQALLAAANQPPQQSQQQQQQQVQQQQSYGGGHSSMASSYQSVNMNMCGPHHHRQNQAMMGGHLPPTMYHHQHGQPGINRNTGHNRFGDSTMLAQFPGDIPERIEPSVMGNATLGHGVMLDIPYGIQQQRLAELGVAGAKRPHDGTIHHHHHHHMQLHKASPPKKKKRRSQRKKPADMPRRPLSAYNLFFSAERQRILKEIEAEETGGAFNAAVAADDEVEEGKDTCQALLRPLVPADTKRRPHRKTHGKIGFQTLAQMVGQRWKQLSVDQRTVYQDLADKDMIRHKDAMEAYYRKQVEDKEASVELEEKAEKEKAEEKDDSKEGDDKETKNQTEGEESVK